MCPVLRQSSSGSTRAVIQRGKRRRRDRGQACPAHVTAYVESFCLTETNKWGKKTGKSMTFTEYLVQRAELYLTEKVDLRGKAKGEEWDSKVDHVDARGGTHPRPPIQHQHGHRDRAEGSECSGGRGDRRDGQLQARELGREYGGYWAMSEYIRQGIHQMVRTRTTRWSSRRPRCRPASRVPCSGTRRSMRGISAPHSIRPGNGKKRRVRPRDRGPRLSARGRRVSHRGDRRGRLPDQGRERSPRRRTRRGQGPIIAYALGRT